MSHFTVSPSNTVRLIQCTLIALHVSVCQHDGFVTSVIVSLGVYIPLCVSNTFIHSVVCLTTVP